MASKRDRAFSAFLPLDDETSMDMPTMSTSRQTPEVSSGRNVQRGPLFAQRESSSATSIKRRRKRPAAEKAQTLPGKDELEVFEEKIEMTSLAGDETAEGPRIQWFFIVSNTLTSLLGGFITTNVIAPATDLFFLCFASDCLLLVLVAMLMEAIILLFKPPDIERERFDIHRLGKWLTSILLMLKLIFLTLFYVAFTLLFLIFQSLFTINTENITIAAFTVLIIIILALAIIAHPAVNLVTRLAPLIDTAEPAPSQTSQTRKKDS
jgi:hypothetical protein